MRAVSSSPEETRRPTVAAALWARQRRVSHTALTQRTAAVRVQISREKRYRGRTGAPVERKAGNEGIWGDDVGVKVFKCSPSCPPGWDSRCESIAIEWSAGNIGDGEQFGAPPMAQYRTPRGGKNECGSAGDTGRLVPKLRR
ncbi:hypothetical protein HPB50_018476 [Hyalomma asiaticum]|uniref:Uncharacterized protein n=1 Tax=Hyalomma asiaticum TaxID=266040 RepID=A0ACB7TKC0_HYAAI|nr:hypothetical protein HPB50_018476 [Hyalomma asiaticum]